MVLQPDAPQISLSGVGPHLARPAPEFEGPRGVPLFPELRIVCSLSHAINTAAQGMEGGGESQKHCGVKRYLSNKSHSHHNHISKCFRSLKNGVRFEVLDDEGMQLVSQSQLLHNVTLITIIEADHNSNSINK